MDGDPYLVMVRQHLPRLLALFDRDRTSASHGLGDRYHWAWGLIDFGNGTFQGAAHGLARLWRNGLWPYDTPREAFVARIDAMFVAAQRLMRRDGSLEEAFPHEGSYCVTALVAYDLLGALELMADEAGVDMAARWQRVVSPMIDFLILADETHAFITNHLATAVGALVRWSDLAGSPLAEARARGLMTRILQHQSEEGWFDEYGGADPGYQSLATCYLADVHERRPHWNLAEPLVRSLRFLWYFAHPDGSFGGTYGSRCTRTWYPGGVETLARTVPEAAALAEAMARSVAGLSVVTLASIDEPNLVPMFNAYCSAACMRAACPAPNVAGAVLPAMRHEIQRRHFAQAGLWIDAGPEHYTVVSTHKGGVVAHYRDAKPALLDDGVVVRDTRGRLASTQALAPANPVRLDGDMLVVDSAFTPMPKRLPVPWQFVVLRLACLTVLRWPALRERVKRGLVHWLIDGQSRWPGRQRRLIQLGAALRVADENTLPAGYERVPTPTGFVAIHMASQGYWQRQDERLWR